MTDTNNNNNNKEVIVSPEKEGWLRKRGIMK